MNLGLIDAAIRGYGASLDEADRGRLAFFRGLWGAAQAAADDAGAGTDAAWEPPSARALRAARREGRSVLAQAPAAVDGAALARVADAVAAAALAHGAFPPAVAEALGAVRWDRVVRASDLALAGSDPAAWLADLEAVLADDGLDGQAARLGTLLASLALRPLIEGPAARASAALEAAGPEGPRPLACPVCGSAPALAHVGGETSTAGRGRRLACLQCGTSWEFERVRCARCGTTAQTSLHFYNVEGDDAHRLAACDECGGYIRTLYAEDALAPVAYEVEDVVMARLDAIARDPSLAAAEG